MFQKGHLQVNIRMRSWLFSRQPRTSICLWETTTNWVGMGVGGPKILLIKFPYLKTPLTLTHSNHWILIVSQLPASQPNTHHRTRWYQNSETIPYPGPNGANFAVVVYHIHIALYHTSTETQHILQWSFGHAISGTEGMVYVIKTGGMMRAKEFSS